MGWLRGFIFIDQRSKRMKKYFAKLGGNIYGVEDWIRFEAKDDETAQEIADEQAEDFYASYEDPYDEDDNPNFFYASISEYNPDEHDEYFDNDGDSWERLV